MITLLWFGLSQKCIVMPPPHRFVFNGDLREEDQPHSPSGESDLRNTRSPAVHLPDFQY